MIKTLIKHLLQLIALMRHIWMMMTRIQSNHASHKAAHSDNNNPVFQHQNNVGLSEVKHRQREGQGN